jgi:Flavin containing amine oxidoreductase
VARTLLEICTVGILAVPTVEVSLLCLLHNVAVCGVTADLLAESEGRAQTKRFVGGTSQIPLRLAAALGDRVVLDSPVLTIDHTGDRVTVTCRGGLVAVGRQVIVTLSPAPAGRIMYDPPLPGVCDQLTQRMPNASAHRCSRSTTSVPGVPTAGMGSSSPRWGRPGCPTTADCPGGGRPNSGTVPCAPNSGVTSAAVPRSRSASSKAAGLTASGSGAATTPTRDRAACSISARH